MRLIASMHFKSDFKKKKKKKKVCWSNQLPVKFQDGTTSMCKLCVTEVGWMQRVAPLVFRP